MHNNNFADPEPAYILKIKRTFSSNFLLGRPASDFRLIGSSKSETEHADDVRPSVRVHCTYRRTRPARNRIAGSVCRLLVVQLAVHVAVHRIGEYIFHSGKTHPDDGKIRVTNAIIFCLTVAWQTVCVCVFLKFFLFFVRRSCNVRVTTRSRRIRRSLLSSYFIFYCLRVRTMMVLPRYDDRLFFVRSTGACWRNDRWSPTVAQRFRRTTAHRRVLATDDHHHHHHWV